MLGESAALGARESRCVRYRLRATRSCYVISRTIREAGELACDSTDACGGGASERRPRKG